MSEVFVVLAWCATISLIAWKYIDTRFKERQMIIQSGLINEDLKYLYGGKRPRRAGHLSALKFGLLLLFAGAGALSSSLFLGQLPYSFRVSDSAPFFILGCIATCGGLGLVLYYIVIARQDKRGTLEKNP